jgi:phosphatidylglycerophosphate synthase
VGELERILMQPSGSSDSRAGRPAGRLVGRCDITLWSLSQAERWRRSLRRAGIDEFAAEGAPWPQAGSIVLIRADYVLDDGLTRALAATPGSLLAVEAAAGGLRAAAAHVPAERAPAIATVLADGRFDPADQRLAGIAVLGPQELGTGHNEALRKRARPFAVSLAEAPRDEAERLTFNGAYKGVTDVITKYLWPAPARAVTHWCAAAGISPNAVTAVSLIFVLLALWQFAVGAFWTGLAAAWIMTFLDTVDGKLARVTLTSSRWGNVFDHGIDLVHPPFWYWAWWYGVVTTIDSPAAWAVSDLALWVVVAGYVIGRLMEGLFIWRFGMEMHVWRRIDSLFRLVTARRNPNLVLLTAATAFGRPDLGFGLVAVWTALSLAFHAVRIGQAGLGKASGRPLTSWLVEPEPSARR